MKAYSLFDSKSKAFNRPWFAGTRGEALREFSDVVSKKDDFIRRHSGDFTLFEIGDFDPTNGGLVPYKTLENLGLATQYIMDQANVVPGAQ